MILHGFDNLDDLCKNYQIEREHIDLYEVLFAEYQCGSWEGCSIILLKRGNDFFVVQASHCSCYGLEGQFEPMPTNKEALYLEYKGKFNFACGEWKDYLEFLKNYFNFPD